MLYDHELELQLDREFGPEISEQDFPERDIDDDKAADSVAAGRMATRRLHAEYRSACKGRRILKRLLKNPLTNDQEIAMLQRRIAALPQLFQDLAALNLKASKLSSGAYLLAYAKLVTPLGYHPREALGTLAEAQAQAQCELSNAKLRAYAECDGMEIDDPENVATQAANGYVHTEVNLLQSARSVTCPDDRSCDVSYSGGGRLGVNFEKV